VFAARVEAALEGRKAFRGRAPFDVVEGPDWLAEAALLPRRCARLHTRHVHGGHRTLREHGGWAANRQHRLAELFEAWDLRRADLITAASHLSCYLPDGTRVTPREPVRVTMPVRAMRTTPPPAQPVVTLVGRVEPRKGPDLLVEAAGLLGDVIVRLVGAEHSPAYTAQLRRRAADLGVSLDILAPQPMGAMEELLLASRVVAVPSRYEPFSMVALEALATGRAVVLSDACGAAEVLGPEHGARVFPAGDVPSLAEQLRAQLDEPLVGQAGRDHVRAHHSPLAAARSKLDAWEGALATR
jgi:glycosyltransferase involved in cell wall biosynthesis